MEKPIKYTITLTYRNGQNQFTTQEYICASEKLFNESVMKKIKKYAGGLVHTATFRNENDILILPKALLERTQYLVKIIG